MQATCPLCACTRADGVQVHTLVALLLAGDLDAALAQGLLDGGACAACEPNCNVLVCAAHEGRLAALAARDRHRLRDARLLRRRSERDAARLPKPSTAQAPALPSAVADVLARALAKARTPR